MIDLHTIEQHHITTTEIDGRPYRVSVRMSHDGVEWVGHIWFSADGWDDDEFRDHGVVPGRTPEAVAARARDLTHEELVRRFSRALADKRRYLALRKITGEVLHKIRYLNQVAASMRSGLLDVEGAAHELDLTEQQLHDLVSRIREHAGVEV